jgi:hypothetical protein
MQAVVGVALQRRARGVLDRHQAIPGVVDELPAGLVPRQVAVGVVGGRDRPADAGDLVLSML